MLASSMALGCLPDAEGVSSWLPFDVVSRAILDVAFGKETPERALHLVHPRPTPWRSIMEAASDMLVKSGVTGGRLLLVDVDQWFSKLEAASVGASDETMKRIVCSIPSPSPILVCLTLFTPARDQIAGLLP
jgi:hypothetical protein